MTQPTAANDPQSRYSLKKQPQQARAKATVEAIVTAAAQILVEQGYDQASTNHIASRAGVSIGSLYEYFPGKEAIFAQLRRREGDRLYQQLIAEPRPTAPRAVIRHLVTTRINFSRDHCAMVTALERQVPRFAVAALEDFVVADFTAISLAYFQEHQHLLRKHQHLTLVAQLLMRMISATIHDFAEHDPARLSDPALTEELIDLVERYVLADDAVS